MIRLTAWEFNDLMEFFDHRDQDWLRNEDRTLFVRVYDSMQAMAVKITHPVTGGPFRLYSLQSIPLSWSGEESDEYIQKVLAYYTGYAMRKKFELFLLEEAKLDPKRVYATAIGLSAIVAEPDIKFKEEPQQAELPETKTSPGPYFATPGPRELTWLLQRGTMGGGYMKIEYRADTLFIEVSMAYPDSGGFSHPLKGTLRPRHGSVKAIAERLFQLGGYTSPHWEPGTPGRMNLERGPSDADHSEHSEEEGGDETTEGLSNDSGAPGDSRDRLGEQAVRVSDEPEPPADVQRLPA